MFVALDGTVGLKFGMANVCASTAELIYVLSLLATAEVTLPLLDVQVLKLPVVEGAKV